MHSPVLTSHSFKVLSFDPLIRNWLSFDKLTELTALVCPAKVFTHSPVETFHNFTVPSLDPLKIN
jgi:hypothetical protein